MKTAEQIAEKIEKLHDEADLFQTLHDRSGVRSYRMRMADEIHEKLALIAALEWALEVSGAEEI
jgi:hypothetical protein